MAAKNTFVIGPSQNQKPIPIWHVIPPASESDYYFKIITDTEEIDLTDIVTKGTITDGATNTVGSFEITIIDPDKTIYDKIATFDDLVLYADYGDPTSLRFRGKIERRGYQDIYTVISGRSVGMIFVDKPIIYASNGKKKKSDILKEIIDINFSEHSINVDNISEDENLIDVNYFEIPFIDIITEICGSSHDFYLNHSYNAFYFPKGSINNMTDGISQEQNHIETTDNADDSESTYSQVRIYGSSVNSIPLIATSELDTTITRGVSKVLKIDNSSIITDDQLIDFTDSQKQIAQEIPKVGTHTALFLPTIQPGEKLFIAIPREGIAPGYYPVISYTHEFDLGSEHDRKTTINLVRRRQEISDIMKGRISFESKISENSNPNNQDFAKRITFNEDSGTHSKTIIAEGYLQVKEGEAVGQWISDIIDLGEDVSRMEFYLTGELLVQQYSVTTSYLWYSLDGGTTWKLSPGNGIQVVGQTGNQLRFRIDLNSNESKAQSIAYMYSRN